VASRKRPVRWGERTGGDHIIIRRVFQSGKFNCAFLCYDEYTNEFQAYPSDTKNAASLEDALLDFSGPDHFIITFRADNADEIKAALKLLKAFHDSSTPNRLTSKGFVEIRVRIISEGARCSLYGSGFPVIAWPLALEYWCLAHNMIKEYHYPDGTIATPYFRKHGVECNAPHIPLGARVAVKKTPKMLESQEMFEPKFMDCVFVGWHRKPGGLMSKRAFFWSLEDICHSSDSLPRLIETNDYEVPPAGEIKFPLFEAREQALTQKCLHYQKDQIDAFLANHTQQFLSWFDVEHPDL